MAIQTRSLFYISLVDESRKELFFSHDSNYGKYPINCSDKLDDAVIAGEAYMKGRVSRIKKLGITSDGSSDPRFAKHVNPDSIKIHEIKFSHGVDE